MLNLKKDRSVFLLFLFILLHLFGWAGFATLSPIPAQAWGSPFTLTNVSVAVSYPSPSSHTFNFSINSPQTTREIQFLYCTSPWQPCITPPGLDTTSVGEGTVTGLTASNWSQITGTNGLIKYENDAGEIPSGSVSIAFNNITNPTAEATFWVRITLFSDAGATNEIEDGIASSSRKGVTVSATVPSATVFFSGFGPPAATVTIKEAAAIVGTTAITSAGSFSKTLTGVNPGLKSYSLYAEESNGRRTATIGYPLQVNAGQTVILSNIFLSPTISLSTPQLYQDQSLTVSGKAQPSATVTIFLQSHEIQSATAADAQGNWAKSSTITSAFAPGTHTSYSKSQNNEGLFSVNSLIESFNVLYHIPGDLNFDNHVNLTDFSILLFYWESSSSIADINKDGKVGLTDFSIMLFYWTG